MTLREANDILQNPKEHWSREIDEAKKYCIEAVKYLVNAADHRFMDEAQIAIKYLDKRMAVTTIFPDGEPTIDIPMIEAMTPICGDCIHFDLVGYCTCEYISDRFRSPIEDASSCKFYSPYPKEGK